MPRREGVGELRREFDVPRREFVELRREFVELRRDLIELRREWGGEFCGESVGEFRRELDGLMLFWELRRECGVPALELRRESPSCE